MTKETNSGQGAMDSAASARIQSVGERNPDSPTAQTGFDRRAQSAADHNAAGKGSDGKGGKAGQHGGK